MENKQYSNEFLARVYGAYFGCECVQCPGTKQETKGTISSLSNLPFYERNNTQLILIRLSQITDEHTIEVAKILSGSRFTAKNPQIEKREDGVTIVWTGGYGKAQISYKLYWWDRDLKLESTSEEYIKAYDYLRGLGYMIPFEGVDLFLAGIAIEKQ